MDRECVVFMRDGKAVYKTNMPDDNLPPDFVLAYGMDGYGDPAPPVWVDEPIGSPADRVPPPNPKYRLVMDSSGKHPLYTYCRDEFGLNVRVAVYEYAG